MLWFEDSDGTTALLGVHARSFRSNFRVSTGTASIQLAVLGCGYSDYRKINGLRSELADALRWFEFGSMAREDHLDGEHRIQKTVLTLGGGEPQPLGKSLNLRLVPHFRTSPGENGDLVIRESALIETEVVRPRSIYDHLKMHSAVRELVDVSSWTPSTYLGQWVHRRDDPLRSMDGVAREERWSLLVNPRLPATGKSETSKQYLFRFADVGPSGIRKWLALRQHFERGINPFMAVLGERSSGLQGRLALTSIGLDGIGYQLALDQGRSDSQANGENHARRFKRVAESIPFDFGVDVDEWSRRAANASNGIKHANRELPDLLTMANTLRENALVFRLWIGCRIGVPWSTLERGLRIDPLGRPHE